MKVFYKISKTSYQVVTRCNEQARMDQKTLGFFVLLTAIFAFISGYYALTSVFGEWDPVRNQYYMSNQTKVLTAIVAFLYATMIGMIDREIVSARTKLVALLRIPLAIIIGIVIAIPLKIKILEDRINQKIYENQVAKSTPFVEERNRLTNTTNEEIRIIEMQIAIQVNKYNVSRERARDEDLGRSGAGLTGLSGQGRFYRYAREEQEAFQREINRLEALKAEKLKERDERLAQLQQDQEIYSSEAVYGLWEKYMVMTQIVREDESGKAKMMVLGLSILFILFELIPSIIKLLNPKNEYDKMTDYNSKMVDKKLEYCLNNLNQSFEYDEYLPMPEIRIKNLNGNAMAKNAKDEVNRRVYHVN